MTRIASVVYGEPFDEVNDVFRSRVHTLDHSWLFGEDRLAMFFRAFLNVILDSLAQREGGKKLTNLVLLVDEVMHPLYTRLNQLDANERVKKGALTGELKTFVSALTDGVLNERLGEAPGKDWNTALLFSSLEVTPFDKIISGRSNILLPTGVLSAESIVDKWWKKSVNIELSNFADVKLKLLAEMLKSLPRLVEATKDFLSKKATSSQEATPLKINAELIRPLFKELLKYIDGRFSVPLIISPQKLFELVYRRIVNFDNESNTLLRTSFFSNTLDEMAERKYDMQLIPQGNLAMLAYHDEKRLISSSLDEIEWNDPERVFLNMYCEISNLLSLEECKESDVLQKTTLGWVMARLITAHNAGIQEMPLHEFFAVSKYRFCIEEESPLHLKIPTAIGLSAKVYDDTAFTALPTMSDDFTDFARKFNNLQLEDKPVVKVFKSTRKQNCDLMVVFRTVGSEELFIVFIDSTCKQEEVFSPNTKKTVKTLNVKQFNFVNNFIEALKTLQNENIKLSPMSKALVKGNYRFIYLTTHSQIQLQENGEKVQQKPDRLVVMTAQESGNFFSILWDWYRTARALHDTTVSDEDEETSN
jgi:hypothetical protein